MRSVYAMMVFFSLELILITCLIFVKEDLKRMREEVVSMIEAPNNVK